MYHCTFTEVQQTPMFFQLNSTNGQPLYLQLMQQIRHAAETGALQDGEQLPGIRTLAERLVVSPNTVAKAYSELEHEGLLELRHGSGAFLIISRRSRALTNRVQVARKKVEGLVEELRAGGLQNEEIRRLFETALVLPAEIGKGR
jgi:GntR family transcriptional regulator